MNSAWYWPRLRSPWPYAKFLNVRANIHTVLQGLDFLAKATVGTEFVNKKKTFCPLQNCHLHFLSQNWSQYHRTNVALVWFYLSVGCRCRCGSQDLCEACSDRLMLQATTTLSCGLCASFLHCCQNVSAIVQSNYECRKAFTLPSLSLNQMRRLYSVGYSISSHFVFCVLFLGI